MKKTMSLLGSFILVAAMTVSCGNKNKTEETPVDSMLACEEIDTIGTIEEVVAVDTVVVEEKTVPAKKKTTTKKTTTVDPTSKEASQNNGSKLAGVQQVNAAGSDIRKDQQKAEMQKNAQTLNVNNDNSKKK